MDKDMMSLLARHDAARPRVLSTDEQQRRDELLTTIVGSPEPHASPNRTKSPGRRRMWWAVAATGAATVLAAAGGLAFVTSPYLTNHPIGGSGGAGSATLSATSLSAWTGTPSALDTRGARGREAVDWCRDNLSGDQDNKAPIEVTLSDLRGQVASVVLTRGQDVTQCLVGPDGGRLSELMDPVPARLGHDALLLSSVGGHGHGDTGFAYVDGFAGDDVTSVTIYGIHHTVQASIGGGRWTAWWPAPDNQGVDDGSDVTITLRDGTTRTIDYGAVPRAQ